MSSSKSLILVVGIGSHGSGTGHATAVRFAKAGFDVACIGRRKPYDVSELESHSIKARSYQLASYAESEVQKVFKQLKADWPETPLRVCVYNASPPFAVKSLLDTTESDMNVAATGLIEAHNWARAAVQAFLDAPEPQDAATARGTLIFTGASASLRGSSKFGAFAGGKAGIRMLSQSIAREFGPKGVHCAHVVIDGMIHTDRLHTYASKETMADPAAILNPAAIANAYYYLTTQDRSAFTQELDLRPAKEKF